jgi:hypothetical protein
MSVFRALQDSAFTDWLLGSESIWAYPTVLTLHTAGLAVLVGASAVFHLRVFGVGASIPLWRFRQVYAFIWPAFAVNLASGAALFVTQAADRVAQPIFYIKLGSITAALWLGQAVKRTVLQELAAEGPPDRLKLAAGAALALWATAIVAGRLMAYYAGT